MPGTAPNAGAGRWRRLTATQYRNSVRDLTGIDVDTSAFLLDTQSGPFAANALLPPQSPDIDNYRAAAESVATRAVANLAGLLQCDTRTVGEDGCAGRFVDAFGARAYRRPLAAADRSALMAVYAVGKEESFAVGIRLVVEAALQSPNFLYLAEYGEGQGDLVRLTGHELAARLAYLFGNSAPDAELTAAAAAGTLATPEGLRAQATRLYAGARFGENAASFHGQLFELRKLAQEGVVSKDPAKYPEFNAALKTAMMDETNKFIAHVFSKGTGTVAEVLTATYSFPNATLARLYGAAAPGADGRVEFRDGTRHGLLTHGSVLATQPAVQTLYQAVLRGKAVRNHLLCQEIAPPPMGTEFMLPPGADKLNQQQLLRVHQENPSCNSCHRLMDSVGFALENYDAIGRYRTTAVDGSPIDATGNLAASDVEGAFIGPRELAAKLATSKDVRACLALQWFRFAFGRDPEAADACSVSRIGEALGKDGGDVREALLALVTTDAFRYRKGQ